MKSRYFCTPTSEQLGASKSNAIMYGDGNSLTSKVITQTWNYERIVQELNTLERNYQQYRKVLGNILAVLNGDGGHRQSEVGIEQAAEEGLERFYKILNEVSKLPVTKDGVRVLPIAGHDSVLVPMEGGTLHESQAFLYIGGDKHEWYCGPPTRMMPVSECYSTDYKQP